MNMEPHQQHSAHPPPPKYRYTLSLPLYIQSKEKMPLGQVLEKTRELEMKGEKGWQEKHRNTQLRSKSEGRCLQPEGKRGKKLKKDPQKAKV